MTPLSLFLGAGPGTILRKTLEQTWWTRTFLGLRCDLATLPPIRPAKIEITPAACATATFQGFRDELGRVSGTDFVEVFLRQSMCDAGVQTLYAATGPDGSPAFAQWLVTARDQGLLHSHQPGRYPILAPDEVLVEGLYTFCRFRRTGVSTNGMAQLLRVARADGARAAYTYVGDDNAPSLRGCANVGFTLDHVRLNSRRLGFRSSVVRPVDECTRQIWLSSTSTHTSV